MDGWFQDDPDGWIQDDSTPDDWIQGGWVGSIPVDSDDSDGWVCSDDWDGWDDDLVDKCKSDGHNPGIP